MTDHTIRGKAVELTEKQLLMLFPTPMFMGKLPDWAYAIGSKKVREMRALGKGRSAPKGASPAFMTATTFTPCRR